tara:strand:+ start:338 stop:709 length:372 start_codon:yes stop_codon:yes gene_type:complete
MCFTRRKNKQKKYKKNKIVPYTHVKNINDITTEDFMNECISCHHCKQIFNLGSNELKINCAGCDKFFHCGIAGKCIGPYCKQTTRRGQTHILSWCVNCVPKIEGNEEKKDGIGTCICNSCYNK